MYIAVQLASLNPAQLSYLEAAITQQPMGYEMSWSIPSSFDGQAFTSESPALQIDPLLLVDSTERPWAEQNIESDLTCCL